MKAVATAILVSIVLALVADPGAAVTVGIVAGALVWQIDQLGARVRLLEQSQRVSDAIQAAPAVTVAPPPPEPAPASYWVSKPAQAPLPDWGNAAAQAAPGKHPGEAEPRRGWTLPALGELEGLVAGRGLAVVGGTALTLGILFFLGSSSAIGPPSCRSRRR